MGNSTAVAGNGRGGEGIFEEAAAADQAITGSNAETKSPVSGGHKSSSADSLDANRPPTGEIESVSEWEWGSWGDSGVKGDGRSATNSVGGSTASNTSKKLEKVFGSWEEVHPAALGIASQEGDFVAGEGGGVHPASFGRISRGTSAQIRCLSFLDNRNGGCCPKAVTVIFAFVFNILQWNCSCRGVCDHSRRGRRRGGVL